MFKQTLSAFIAVSGLSAAASAQTPQTCTLPEIVDQAPLQQVSGSDLVTVPVTINGATKQFLLDVGMTKPTTVSPELMAKLSLPEIPKFGGSFGGIGGAGTGMAGGASFGSGSF